MNLNNLHNFYLMGIKGVAMTSIAQILLDANKQVSGCDVAGEFVTKKILDRLQLQVDKGFVHTLPENIDCVIYTSAHGGPINPIVTQAQECGLTTLSQAEALAHFFNQKKGMAVCGVGGKSTVSAMITWILDQLQLKPSFSVGVGEIIDMNITGRWNQESEFFVAEADEYVIDPACCNNPDEMTPRFSFLQPFTTVCTNLAFDHPDVYNSIEHTQKVFLGFFEQIKNGGNLIFNADSQELVEIVSTQTKVNKKSFGTGPSADTRLVSSSVKSQKNIGVIKYGEQEYSLELAIPGEFNLLNALAACLATETAGVAFSDALQAISSFKGTQRRFEFIGQKNGVYYYDDYAHHPQEITATIKALKSWCPNQRQVVAFQPHTFSRTKQFFNEFVDALSIANEVVLLKIFPSAREAFDDNISSEMIAKQIQTRFPQTLVHSVESVEELAEFAKTQLKTDDVLLTVGAGDIYEVHEQLQVI